MTPELQSKLQAYHDGELDASTREQIQAQLKTSPTARKYLQQLQTLTQTLQQPNTPTPDTEQAWAQIQPRLTTDNQPSKTIPFPKILQTAAAILLFAAISWFSYNTLQPPTQNTHPAEEYLLVETELEGASSIVYVDEESGWTVVWVNEPETDTPHI